MTNNPILSPEELKALLFEENDDEANSVQDSLKQHSELPVEAAARLSEEMELIQKMRSEIKSLSARVTRLEELLAEQAVLQKSLPNPAPEIESGVEQQLPSRSEKFGRKSPLVRRILNQDS